MYTTICILLGVNRPITKRNPTYSTYYHDNNFLLLNHSWEQTGFGDIEGQNHNFIFLFFFYNNSNEIQKQKNVLNKHDQNDKYLSVEKAFEVL